MMLVIRTQYMENYGDAKDPYWKFKGGSEYKILGVPLSADHKAVVAAASVERDTEYFRENVIDWSIESDDYLSWFEKSQMEYDGTIVFPEPSMNYGELMEFAQ